MPRAIKEMQQLIGPNLRKKLFVVFSYPTASAQEIIPHIPEHLRYIAMSEDQIFLSGPFIREGQLVGEEMTVLHTDSEVKAAEFMRKDPLVKLGLSRFELKQWELREGTLNIVARLSESSFTMK